jgi:hypothetical protein
VIIAFFFLFEPDKLIIRKLVLSMMHKYVKIKWKAAGCMKKLYWLKGQRGAGQTITLSDWLHHYPIPTGPLHKTIIRIALSNTVCSEQSYYYIIYTVHCLHIVWDLMASRIVTQNIAFEKNLDTIVNAGYHKEFNW